MTRPSPANPFRLFSLVVLLAMALPAAALAGATTQLTTNAANEANTDATLDYNDVVHVVYARDDGKIYYRSRTSTTWSDEELVATGTSPAIGAGPSSVPQVAYLSGGGVWFTERVGGTWMVPVQIWASASRVDLAVDAGDVAHVVFLGNYVGDPYVDIVYTNNSGGAFFATPPRVWDGFFSYGLGNYFSSPVIAVDPAGNYVIGYKFKEWYSPDWGTVLHVYRSATNDDVSTGYWYKGEYPEPRNNGIVTTGTGLDVLVYGTTMAAVQGPAGAGSWTPTPLPAGSSHTLALSLPGSLHVAYVNGTGGIEYAAGSAGGFGAPVVLDSRTSGRNPVVITQTDPLVAYEAIDSGDYEVYLARVSNQAPDLFDPGDQSVNEASDLYVSLEAGDGDGDELTFSATSLPTGASLNPSTGILSWTPTYTQAGSYELTFQVSDGRETDSETITITVVNVNREPVLGSIGDQSVDENESLSFTVSATDPDGDPLVYSATDLPAGASFDPLTRVFSWTPTYDQAGSHDVTFEVSDGGPTLWETITITVNNVNRAPVLDPIGNKSVNENENLSFTLSATDPDGDPLTYSLADPPAGVTFDSGTGAFSWTPTYEQAAAYTDMTFQVTDGDGVDLETITITVNDVNRAPVLDPVGNRSTDEDANLFFSLSATDPDGDTLAYGAAGLPTGATLNPATGDFSWTPTYEEAGTHDVTFTVTDDGTPPLNASETITITVYNVNRAPVLDTIGDKSVDENATLTFTVSATDPDDDPLTYGAIDLPTGATFDLVTRAFSWTPTYEQAGAHEVTFGVSDGGGPPVSETIAITVNDVNRAPVLAAIGDRSIDEGATLTVTLSATDEDGDTLTFGASGLPTGASFDPATRTFSWTPTYEQAGSFHGVGFTVTDDGTPNLNDSETITITVNPVNAPPVLDPIGDRSVSEGATLSFTVSATDVDSGDVLTYGASGLPTGATFDPGTRIFSWTPGYEQAGSHAGVVFTVTDDGTPNKSDSEAVTLTVDNVNRAPVLDAIGDKSVMEGHALTFTLSATDEDGDTLTYSATSLPAGATLNPTTGAFSWTPAYDQAGDHAAVVFTAADAEASASESITITVTDNPTPPGFFTVVPCRVIDTRSAAGDFGGPALVAGADRTFDVVAGACGIPASARAISVNVTVTQPTAAGNLRLYPAGVPLPTVSTINYSAGQTRGNNAIVRLSELGELTVRCAQASGTAHFILDVNGYFQEEGVEQ